MRHPERPSVAQCHSIDALRRCQAGAWIEVTGSPLGDHRTSME
jgi:hypothetical protein